MTAALEKLTDLARGTARLRAAVGRAGAEVYTRFCEELNLASDSIDDIPNREVLRQLVNRMESVAADLDANTATTAERTVTKAANASKGILRDLSDRGVTVRLYRDRSQYEAEELKARRFGQPSSSRLLIGAANVHIRVKQASEQNVMHLNSVFYGT
jgi:hypothetical protein